MKYFLTIFLCFTIVSRLYAQDTTRTNLIIDTIDFDNGISDTSPLTEDPKIDFWRYREIKLNNYITIEFMGETNWAIKSIVLYNNNNVKVSQFNSFHSEYLSQKCYKKTVNYIQRFSGYEVKDLSVGNTCSFLITIHNNKNLAKYFITSRRKSTQFANNIKLLLQQCQCDTTTVDTTFGYLDLYCQCKK